MYRIGKQEVEAVNDVLASGKLFRYGIGTACTEFEKRYGEFLGVRNVLMTSSGTTALTAALAGNKIGPGDEVLVPACTYIATAIAVLSVGAIPVVIDVDESLTMDPLAAEAAISSHTKALLPVHMWGLVADMDAIMAVAKRHNLKVIEDACQCVGGGYKGQMVGSIGDAGAFSFNYYKNMTCGEGGAVVTNDDNAFPRMGCMIDCCSFYWKGRENTDMNDLFVASGSRASEVEGAIMNVQLDRLPGIIASMRKQKMRILHELEDTKLVPAKYNSIECDCGTHVAFQFPTAEVALAFAKKISPCFIAGRTGRHVYTEWDPLFRKQVAPHPAMNPYFFKENAECRKELTKDQCAKSLEILNRTVLIPTHPDNTDEKVSGIIANIRSAANATL